jgi:hypothetical protein
MIQNPEGDGLMLMMGANKEELKNAPTFKSKKEQGSEKEAAERARERPQMPAQPRSPTPQPRATVITVNTRL